MKEKLCLLIFLLSSVLFGCGNVTREIAAKSVDTRSDVFYEVKNGEPRSSNEVDLVIKAQLKTNFEGFYLLESKNTPQGKPFYSFLLNIDGQHVVWQMAGLREITSYYDAEGKRTSEGGPGMRYTLEKKIRLTPGVHKVFIALPGNEFTKQFEVNVVSGEVNVLELDPIYLQDSHRRQTYLRGIKDFRIVFSSKPAGKNDRSMQGEEVSS